MPIGQLGGVDFDQPTHTGNTTVDAGLGGFLAKYDARVAMIGASSQEC
jgi:hypothetical protein